MKPFYGTIMQIPVLFDIGLQVYAMHTLDTLPSLTMIGNAGPYEQLEVSPAQLSTGIDSRLAQP
jgi:hypothetical protein